MSGRIRSIKPEWLEDELLAAASDEARTLSIGLILIADDYGNGRASVATIAASVWRYQLERDDGAKAPEVLARASRAFRELLAIGFIGTWTQSGQRYYTIRNWARHQRVDKPGKPAVPSPPSDVFEREITDSGESRETVPANSGESRDVPVPDWKGEEGKGEEESSADARGSLAASEHFGSKAPDPESDARGSGTRKVAKRAPSKGTRPDDFTLTEQHIAHAASKGWPEWWARNRFEVFCEKAEAKGWVYANWDKALYGFWSGEIRYQNGPKELAHLAPRPGSSTKPAANVAAEKARLEAEFTERRRRELRADQPDLDGAAAKAQAQQAIGGLF